MPGDTRVHGPGELRLRARGRDRDGEVPCEHRSAHERGHRRRGRLHALRLSAEKIRPRKRLGTLASSRVFLKPFASARARHVSNDIGWGTQAFPRSLSYSTSSRRPTGFSMPCTSASTGVLSRTKWSEFAITAPSTDTRSVGFVKSSTSGRTVATPGRGRGKWLC